MWSLVWSWWTHVASTARLVVFLCRSLLASYSTNAWQPGFLDTSLIDVGGRCWKIVQTKIGSWKFLEKSHILSLTLAYPDISSLAVVSWPWSTQATKKAPMLCGRTNICLEACVCQLWVDACSSLLYIGLQTDSKVGSNIVTLNKNL